MIDPHELKAKLERQPHLSYRFILAPHKTTWVVLSTSDRSISLGFTGDSWYREDTRNSRGPCACLDDALRLISEAEKSLTLELLP